MTTPAPSALPLLRRSIFLVSLPLFILGLLLPVYGREIGASVVEIGLFFTAFSLVTVLLRPLVGWGLDRFGRRGFFLAGLGGYALTMLSFAFIDQVWGILLARVFQGMASSLLWLSANAITADLAGERERGGSFGGVAQASSQGAILGTFLAYIVLNTRFRFAALGVALSRWMLLFMLYGGFSLIAFFLALRLPETRPAFDIHQSEPIRWSRPWALLLLVTLVTGASAAMLSPVLIIYLQDRLGASVEAVAWAFLPTGLVWALLPSRLGKLADRFGRKPLMLLGLGAAALSSFLLPALGSLAALAVLWAFQALCYAAGDLAGRDQRGRAYGLYVMCADLGAAFGPLGGAWLYQSAGPASPFYANGLLLALCALALAIFLKLPRRQPVPAAPEPPTSS